MQRTFLCGAEDTRPLVVDDGGGGGESGTDTAADVPING